MLLVGWGRSLVRESVDILGDRFIIEIRGDRPATLRSKCVSCHTENTIGIAAVDLDSLRL